MSVIWTLDGTENKRDVYRGKDCMEKFCKSFKEQAMEIINFEYKKKKPLTKEQQELSKICYIYKRKFIQKHTKYKIYCKFSDYLSLYR